MKGSVGTAELGTNYGWDEGGHGPRHFPAILPMFCQSVSPHSLIPSMNDNQQTRSGLVGSGAQQVQRTEGVLAPGRPAATASQPLPAPTTSTALPVKNNAILTETLGILKEFREQVDAAVSNEAPK